MNNLLFIVFIITGVAMDRNQLAGLVCVTALVTLYLLDKKERRTTMGYKTCPYCGAHLDPGEVCDCQTEAATSQQGQSEHNSSDYKKKEEK